MYLQISNRTLFAPISLLTSSLAYPSVYFHLHLVTTQYIQIYHAPPRPPDLSEVSRLSKWHYHLTNCSRALLGVSLFSVSHLGNHQVLLFMSRHVSQIVLFSDELHASSATSFLDYSDSLLTAPVLQLGCQMNFPQNCRT